MSFIKTDDNVKLYYETTGKGEPIIFVHEFAGDFRSWAPQVNYFSRYNQCITFCARGYYPSDVPENENKYSQERAWRDIISVMDNLEIEKAHIVGLSMGGFATLHLGINAPNRVLSLVIAGCGYGAIPIDKINFNKEADFSNVSLETAQNIINQGMEKIGSEYALGPSRVQFQNKDPIGWKLFRDQLVEHNPIGSANTLLGVQNKRPNLYAIEKDISTINSPTLIINGDEDDMCLEVGLFLKRTIHTSGLLIVPKTGHTINLEEPSIFNNHLLEFYSRINASTWNKRDERAHIIKV
ncbi:MAG: alpha/beta fold hydrolase [Candidatus Puniceispirillales bacterium]|jgi:pimeloyl-ACP methyl ester carboxylesterase|nr:alpha/beta hydrolase [Alphaproteobacteria bacterium]MBL6850977.1 alpha/beta hydrolase [Alphaproteobacteria bacterium]MDA0916225.1 alpha/beta hydrolase [Pseudomonadota bacterium]